MSLHIVRNDIARMHCDAIVNAANTELRRGGGVCGAIFSAADADALERDCYALAPCPTGSAVATPGHGLACKWIIHAVGPIWQGGGNHEEELLRSAYRSALRIVQEKGCESAAFPLISAGIYGFPMEAALRIATEELQSFFFDRDAELYLVIYSRESVLVGKSRFIDIQSYIDDRYVDLHKDRRKAFKNLFRECQPLEEKRDWEEALPECSVQEPVPKAAQPSSGRKLRDLLSLREESFSDMVLRLIREKDMKEVEVYKAANLDRKLFSKLRSNPDYQPSKNTALALAVGLRLNVDETRDLLGKAGFALSRSSKQDIIVEYFLEEEIFDIMTINEALFDFDQHLLGA